ncbi:MAG: esterase/lipase family protein [Bryobacteraceae bacterium]
MGLDAKVGREMLNPLNRPIQPIVLVPGIMGSRIHKFGDPKTPIWDPDDTLAMLKLADLMTEPRRKLVGLTTSGQVFKKGSKAASLTPLEEERGWGGLAWGFYGPGLQALRKYSQKIGGVVYGFGYDWRQSNWLSGSLLKDKIAKIRAENEDKKVLVVTHSMGGLVTRAACKLGAESDVIGVVHTMQPANGTPLAYRQFKTGGAALHWVLADVVLGRIVGRTPIQYHAMNSGLRAPYELLPNDFHYRTTGNEENEPPGKPAHRKAWLTMHKDVQVSLPPSYSMYDVYRERTGKLGLIDYDYYQQNESLIIGEGWVIPHRISGKAIYEGVIAGVEGARKFHQQRLGSYVHPNTSVVAGTGLETDVAVHMDHNPNWFSPDTADAVMKRENHGDATVALSSATCLPLKARPDINLADKDRQGFVKGVGHAAAFAESDAFNCLVWKMCEQVLLCGDK